MILLLLAGDGIKRTWMAADLPVKNPAPTARPLDRNVVPASETKRNQTVQVCEVSGKFAIPTTIAPEPAAPDVLGRPKPLDKDQLPTGLQNKGLPLLRFELEDLKGKTASRPPARLPAPKKQASARGEITYLGEIVFDPGKVELTKRAEAKVKKMAARISAARDAAAVVEGHADRSRLSPKTRRKYGDNYGLSLVRAAAVARALVAAGVDPGRVYLIAYGAGLSPASQDAGRMVRVGIRPDFLKK